MDKMIKSVAEQKKELRNRMRAAREALTPEKAQQAALAAQARVSVLPCWDEARTVALYVAFRSEMSAAWLFEQAWTAGKRVLAPRCRPCLGAAGGLGMELAAVTAVEQLCPGAFGILEPDPARCPACGLDEAPDLLVAPGLAFDRQGYRLGYGGGFYDRYLARPEMQNTFCVGLGYALQIVESLPSEPWDKPLRCVCTEEEIICP